VLIKQGHVRRISEGMDEASDGAPESAPPWMSPHCRSCGLVCERFTIPRETKGDYIPCEWQCCGKTGGTWVPRTEAVFKSRNGGIIWVNGAERIITSGR